MNVADDRAKSIFLNAVEIAAPEERRAFVQTQCAGDESLRGEVEALLRHQQSLGNFLDSPPAGLNATIDWPLSEGPGTVIGPYKLLQQIGEGGMGVVFMAEQSRPVRRQVALKVIKAGMDTRQVLARFEAERQALALMDHPNIAKVFDAGVTEAGRPYFVMELVKGTAITNYCDEHRLPPRARLELFVQVCQAVQHAHTKGIIHRDLKPSNVLVALYDGKPVPKVIDFGVAKATGQRLTDATMLTGFGDVIGTLEYMSPEQAEVNQLDVDTRSDVYSLGVLLYELLTGSTPLEKERIKRTALLEVLRFIRDEEPPRPSTRLSTAEQLPSIAASRGLEPRKLSGLVRGELDWVVMKALEKDRARRYETANSFANDVRRYLADESVQACPPTAAYRFRKFARRNKATIAFTGLVLLILLTFSGGIGWNVRDRAARQAAIEQEVESALRDAERWQAQASWPEALSAVKRAQGMLAAGGGDDIRQRAEQLRKDLDMVMRLEAVPLLMSEWKVDKFNQEASDRGYGRAFRDYGIDVMALPADEAAARIRARAGVAVALVAAVDDWAHLRRVKADRSALTAIAQAVDPDLWRRQVRQAAEQQDAKALTALAASPELLRQPPTSLRLLARVLGSHGLQDVRTAVLRRAQRQYPGDFWINYGLAWALGELEPPQHDESISFYRAALAVRPQSIAAYNQLGVALDHQGKLDEAIACYERTIALDPSFSYPYVNLGLILIRQGKVADAIACYRKATELDPENAKAHAHLGDALQAEGKLDEAVTCYHRALDLDPQLTNLHTQLGSALLSQGKVDDAVACCRKGTKLEPKNADAHYALALALTEGGEVDGAVAAYRKTIELNPKYAEAHNNLANALKKQGNLEEATANYRKAVELDPKLVVAHRNLGNDLMSQGKIDESIACYRAAIDVDPKYVSARYNLGLALSRQGKLDDAAASFESTTELDPEFADAHYNLAITLHKLGRPDEAISRYRRVIQIDPTCVEAHVNLGVHLYDLGEVEQAIACYRRAIELDPKRTEAIRNLANAYFKQGTNFAADGKAAEAIDRHRKAIETDPKFAAAHEALGNALMSQGTMDEAIACYRKAVALEPRSPRTWQLLGWAHYRDGDWPASVAALVRSTELQESPKGGDSWQWFFLAMAHWQLGNKEEARRWYAEAVEWMGKNKPKDEELLRFRTEAEELLKIDDPTPTTKP